MNRKTTNVDLVTELEAKNTDGKYDEIITNAKNNIYHDFKSPRTMPKVDLVQDLGRFPELGYIRQDVISGHYDEPADEEDKTMMRKDLEANGDDGTLAKALGLSPED